MMEMYGYLISVSVMHGVHVHLISILHATVNITSSPGRTQSTGAQTLCSSRSVAEGWMNCEHRKTIVQDDDRKTCKYFAGSWSGAY